ncbi:hypothetical protein CMEL01_11497 [Colletotrichum melonis]|uniref:Secreted protein n=1 Tax=Colletotrichum melonis TaxID=1209925 RepID=A0AAI9UZ34_9PEZI|nr:hypothetical protein CMEL01_11497 [Colletotrichum melonis]
MSPRSRMVVMMLMMFSSFLSSTANLPSLICIQPPSQAGQVCRPSARLDHHIWKTLTGYNSKKKQTLHPCCKL